MPLFRLQRSRGALEHKPHLGTTHFYIYRDGTNQSILRYYRISVHDTLAHSSNSEKDPMYFLVKIYTII